MDNNQGEMDKLYQWACKYHTNELEEKYFTKIDRECGSYYEKRETQTEYCREYKFQTMPELKAELIDMWKEDSIMEQIEKVVLVSSFKNKPFMDDNDEQGAAEENKKQLKPYIYNF